MITGYLDIGMDSRSGSGMRLVRAAKIKEFPLGSYYSPRVTAKGGAIYFRSQSVAPSDE